MPPEKNNFKIVSGLGINQSVEISGLNQFVNNLGKHFFASISIDHSAKKLNKIGIVLEMHLNFELSEILDHYESGFWGCLQAQNHTFLKLVNQLKEANNNLIEIDELTLHFNNTSIVINQIYENSIAEQFDAIIKKLSENYLSFSQGLSRVPYEIFIPVFEEEIHVGNQLNKLLNNSCPEVSHKDYFKFWALYYEGERKAAIYDTRLSTITSGDLFYLNND